MLRARLSLATYIAIYDDDLTGSITEVDASEGVALTLSDAHSLVVSRLGTNYTHIPLVTDIDVPFLLKSAELNYAVGISYDRHPEYIRAYGTDPQRKNAYDRAEMTMERIQQSLLKFADAPSMPEPANIGGLVIDGGQRVFLDSSTGQRNSGDF
jgi:hypothetical protein